MKRRDLIRHLENSGCESRAKAAITPCTSIVARRSLPRFRGIARSSTFSRERFVKIWTFPSREFPQRTFLSRHSFSEGECSICRPHFCSMKITEDVRKYAAEQKVSNEEALQIGLEEKAREFTEAGAELYSKA